MTAGETPFTGRDMALLRLNMPGLFLVLLEILGMGTAVIMIMANLLGSTLALAELGSGRGGMYGDDTEALANMLGSGIGIVFQFFGIITSLIVTIGGWQMRKGETYGLAIAAALIATVPCTSPCCCLFGMPVGIWSLIVLSDESVKRVFR